MPNKLRMDEKWGCLQVLHVEADTYGALLGAMTVACVEHTEVTHYSERKRSYVDSDREHEKDIVCLKLMWSKDDSDEACHPLPFPLNGAEEMAQFVRQWLEKKADYDVVPVPDTDGSVNRGFRVEHCYSYGIVRVTPIYIIYGK